MKKNHAQLVRESNIQEGDYVRIVRKIPSRSNGWSNSWVPEMDKCIGKIGIVSYLDEQSGVAVSVPGVGGFGYSIESLELIDNIELSMINDNIKSIDKCVADIQELVSMNNIPSDEFEDIIKCLRLIKDNTHSIKYNALKLI